MPWYPDLRRLDYFDGGTVDSTNLRAIGWLARKHEYFRGEVSPAFSEKLRQLFVSPWAEFGCLGYHGCELCPTGMPGPIGKDNLFVPGEDCIYVAPELVVHYVEAHQYKPPEEFIRFVLECPPTGSTEYMRRLLDANDGHPFWEVRPCR